MEVEGGPNSIVTDKTTMIEFMLKYKELECLWNTAHPHYGNKNKRLECLKELLVVLKRGRPDADIYTVKTKINSIRSNFKKQYRKIMQNLKEPVDEEYLENTVKYYSLLKFLVPSIPLKKETQDLDKEMIYLEEDYLNDDSNEEYPMKDEEESYLSTTPPSQTRERIVIFPRQSSKKRRLAEQKMESNDETEEAESSYRQQYSSYGDHIAEKLRCMPKKMAIYCQKIMNDAIYQAEIGDLNKTSRIVTDFDLP